jgi:serine/threonine protein kinase
VLTLALGAARGVEYLHSQKPPIIWRDCKSANYLVGVDDRIVLADLGESREIRDKMTRGVGTPLWMAPEVVRGKGRRAAYTEKADVYGLGIVFWELLTRRTPFEEVEDFSVDQTVLKDKRRPELPADVYPPFGSLVARMWAPEPDNRPTAAQVASELEKILRELPGDKARLPAASAGAVSVVAGEDGSADGAAGAGAASAEPAGSAGGATL